MPDTDPASPLLSYITKLVPQSGLESIVDPFTWERFADDAIAWADRGRSDQPHASQKDAVRAAFEALLSDTDPASAKIDEELLATVILPWLRPVGDIADGKLTLPKAGEFADYVSSANIRTRLENAIQGVGCIVTPGNPSIPYAGTGFVVGDGLVMTARNAARNFSSGTGTKRLSFVSTIGAVVDPDRESEHEIEHRTFPVRKVVMLHPYWDMALLHVPDLAMPRLQLAPIDPSLGRRRIALVGYPALDSRLPTDVQQAILRGRSAVKRVAPGYLTGIASTPSFENTVSAATHDAHTQGGNSGAPLIDVETGHVVALSFASHYLGNHFAVPVAALARDARVIDAGVSFTETHRDPKLPWEKAWTDADAQKPVVLAGHEDHVSFAAWSPDGKRIVTASSDRTARIWNADGSGPPIRLVGHSDRVTGVAWSPAGQLIATASADRTVKLWDAATGRAVGTFVGHRSAVFAVAWSPSGKDLVTASEGKTLKIWDAESGQAVRTLEGHTGAVFSVAWSPDGRRIVSASEDTTARIWDAATGKVLAILRGHTGPVRSASWHPDGKRIVTGSADQTTRVWNTPP